MTIEELEAAVKEVASVAIASSSASALAVIADKKAFETLHKAARELLEIKKGVDVEGLRLKAPLTSDRADGEIKGWNACIDRIASRGLLRAVPDGFVVVPKTLIEQAQFICQLPVGTSYEHLVAAIDLLRQEGQRAEKGGA